MILQQLSYSFPKFSRSEKHLYHRAYIRVPGPPPIARYRGTGPLVGCKGAESAPRSREHRRPAAAMRQSCRGTSAHRPRATVPTGCRRALQLAGRTHAAALVEPAPLFPWGLQFAEPAPTLASRAAVRRTHVAAPSGQQLAEPAPPLPARQQIAGMCRRSGWAQPRRLEPPANLPHAPTRIPNDPWRQGKLKSRAACGSYGVRRCSRGYM
jgi:hypothetical protein